MQAHEIQVAEDREYMSAMARLNANAFRVQDEHRLDEEAGRKRIMDEAVAQAEADAAEFHSVRSDAVSIVRKKHGNGRRANLAASLANRRPAIERHVRNEREDGIASKLVKGVGRGVKNAMSTLFIPPEYR